jgi:hypothetical protein
MKIGIGITVCGGLLRGFAVGLVLVVALYLTAASAADEAFEQLDPNAYQSFVANWEPDVGPLCAIVRTQADWDLVLRPAPTMGRTKPFSPPPEFWKFKAILLVAHVVGAGGTSDVFHAERLVRDQGGLWLHYRFTPPPFAPSKVKLYLAVAVVKPLPRAVHFLENGRLLCTLRTHDMVPVTPPPAPR